MWHTTKVGNSLLDGGHPHIPDWIISNEITIFHNELRSPAFLGKGYQLRAKGTGLRLSSLSTEIFLEHRHRRACNLPPRGEEENWRSSLHVENNRAHKKHKPKGQSLCGTRISENSQF